MKRERLTYHTLGLGVLLQKAYAFDAEAVLLTLSLHGETGSRLAGILTKKSPEIPNIHGNPSAVAIAMVLRDTSRQFQRTLQEKLHTILEL